MPTISFVSPKGGVGKTTTAVLLGCELALKAKVAILDADPNRPVSAWASLAKKPENLEVIDDVTEENIIDRIDALAERLPFVLIDLEGTGSTTVAYAIMRSDLVVIPCQGSQLDARQAARAISLIRNQEKAVRRKIPHVVLFTRTSAAIRPRTLRHIEDALRKHGVDVLETQLLEREAFRAIFSFGGTIRDLERNAVSNVEAAASNIRAVAQALIQRLKQAKAQEAAE